MIVPDQTTGDMVGRVEKALECQACDRPMTGHGKQTICRWYGLKLTPALAEDCRKFVPAVPVRGN